jgi:hypothetical protein
VCSSGADYVYEPGSFDAAVCLGASFIWGGFSPTLKALKNAVRPGGRIAVGEPYWLSNDVPVEVLEKEPDIQFQTGLLQAAWIEGLELEYMVSSSLQDWDHYEAGNWYGLARWLEDNPTHPERSQVLEHLRRGQQAYMEYGREYIGWAMFVLGPGQR